jgi:hypothetical protein
MAVRRVFLPLTFVRLVCGLAGIGAGARRERPGWGCGDRVRAGQAVGKVLIVITLCDPDGATEMLAPRPDFLMVRLPLYGVMLLD